MAAVLLVGIPALLAACGLWLAVWLSLACIADAWTG